MPLVAIALFILNYRVKKSIVFKIYLILMLCGSVGSLIWIDIYDIFVLNKFWVYLITPLIASLFYIFESFLTNVIMNRVVILDYKFYFTGKLRLNRLIVSVPILLMEEVVFRLPIIITTPCILLNWCICFFSSICFGIIHIYFSKKDMISKMALGFLLGGMIIFTKSLAVVCLLHFFYNLFVFQSRLES